MEDNFNKSELIRKISEISNIADEEIINNIISTCLTYRKKYVQNIKNDIGVLAKIAEKLFLIIDTSDYGTYDSLNTNYVILSNYYTQYHNELKSILKSDFSIKTPVWMKCNHLLALQNYFKDYNSYNFDYDLFMKEKSIFKDIVSFNIIKGTENPKIPEKIDNLLKNTDVEVSNLISQRYNDDPNHFSKFKNIIYQPDYYELTVDIDNRICLNGIPISSRKPNALSNPDRMIDTMFKKENSNNYFSFDIKTERAFTAYFNEIGLTSEYRKIFFPNSKFKANKIFFKPFVKRDEILDKEILSKFDKFLKENGAPATIIPIEEKEEEILDLSDLPF
ncbi:MAG: hypothetical protein HXK93_02830 [Candidatus Nanogingivalaceae bacterium]|jgi:hypothetical protein|nr:hypothetical protein [Candidatus Nanogingivalaceae bacterium]